MVSRKFKPSSKDIGQQAEQTACQFLQSQGLQLVTQNFRCACGEIDLIMQDKDTLAFIEVRTRQHKQFANALESIDRNKQRKIIRTAHYYLQQKNLTFKMYCRFDVIAINPKSQLFEWIKNAFIEE